MKTKRWEPRQAKVELASSSKSTKESSKAGASSSSTSKHQGPVRRTPPYYMDDDGHVYAQEYVGGSTTYLGILDHVLPFLHKVSHHPSRSKCL